MREFRTYGSVGEALGNRRFYPEYPKKTQLGLLLLENFKRYYPEITVKCILTDALYGLNEFMSKASDIFWRRAGYQPVKSKPEHTVQRQNKKISDYFNFTNKGVSAIIQVRGGEKINATVASARLKVDAHDGKKRFVIALKYEGETEYRYLVATDVSWRTLDIIQAYSLSMACRGFL